MFDSFVFPNLPTTGQDVLCNQLVNAQARSVVAEAYLLYDKFVSYALLYNLQNWHVD